ncbi:hypothetical protein L0V05_14520 [Tabrizicola sp. J26]|nr:hypothetical protein [Tabrizicola rongguiensis]
MSSPFRGFVLGVVLAVATVQGSSAATITFKNDGRNLVDASRSTDLQSGASWLAGPDIVSGSVSGQYRSTFENGADTFASDADRRATYFRVHDGQTATLKVGRSSALSLLWGSVDTYNRITLRDTVTGAALNITIASLKGVAEGLGAALLSVKGFTFNRVDFWSSGNSIEFSNITTTPVPAPVPLPAGGVLMLSAIGSVALLRRRRARHA